MAKYFNNDSFIDYQSDIIKENTQKPKINYSIPKQESVKPKIKSDVKKDEYEEIEKFKNIVNETNIVNEKLNDLKKTLPEETLKAMNEELKKFQPLQIFERLNMIIFILSRLEKRVAEIEKNIELLKEGKNISPKIDKEEKLKPKNDENIKQENNNEMDWMDVQQVRNYVKEKMSAPEIPEENYIDKSMNIEEIFKDKPKEAIEAAYQGMLESNSKTQEEVEKGKMRGIIF